jgi:hypothetical protein
LAAQLRRTVPAEVGISVALQGLRKGGPNVHR